MKNLILVIVFLSTLGCMNLDEKIFENSVQNKLKLSREFNSSYLTNMTTEQVIKVNFCEWFDWSMLVSQMVKYEEDKKTNIMYCPEYTINNGAGDCDSLAYLSTRYEKIKDFKYFIIIRSLDGMFGHCIAVYTDNVIYDNKDRLNIALEEYLKRFKGLNLYFAYVSIDLKLLCTEKIKI